MSESLRIAVCMPQVPLVRGGAEVLADRLVEALNDRGHEAMLVTVPYRWHPDDRLLENLLLWRLLDFDAGDTSPDLVIGTKFPSYLARHPRKVVWLFHQFRQAYDYHGTRFAQFADDARGAAMREAVRRADEEALAEACGIFTISANVANRLLRFNGVRADVIYPPPQLSGLRWIGDDGTVLSVGRLDAAKRTDLLIRALAMLPAGQAVIVGEGQQREPLERLAAELGVTGRVTFRGRVDDDELREAYGRCRCVYYGPFDEDFGMVTVEAHLAGKPVVTTTDSGGVLEFVRHAETGLVAEPAPVAIATALRRLLDDADLARRLGGAGRAAARLPTWDDVVGRLLEAVA